MKRLIKINVVFNKKLVFARNKDYPNAISLEEIKNNVELTPEGKELFDKTKYQKITNNDYCDYYYYGASPNFITKELDISLIEYHEFLCIDENNNNFGKIKTIVAIKTLDDNFIPVSFLKTRIYSSEFENIPLLINNMIVKKNPNELASFIAEFSLEKELNNGEIPMYLFTGGL